MILGLTKHQITAWRHIHCAAMQHSNIEHLPAQHTQNQVENKEGSEDDQADKVDPRQLEAHRIIHLKRNRAM